VCCVTCVFTYFFTYFLCYFSSYGRGQPEDLAIISEGLMDDGTKDPDALDKRRSAGQILWIRGLTRLQTQVNQYLLSSHQAQCLWVFFSLCVCVWSLPQRHSPPCVFTPRLTMTAQIMGVVTINSLKRHCCSDTMEVLT
jgi:hypothetical protein